MFFIGEYFILEGKKNPSAIHQIYDGKSIFHGDFLSTEILFAGHGKPRSGFYCGIVGYDHDLLTTYGPDSDDHPRCRTTSVFLVHSIGGKTAQFVKFMVVIYQIVIAFACGKLILSVLLFDFFLSSARFDLISSLFHLTDKDLMVVAVFFLFDVDHGFVVRLMCKQSRS